MLAMAVVQGIEVNDGDLANWLNNTNRHNGVETLGCCDSPEETRSLGIGLSPSAMRGFTIFLCRNSTPLLGWKNTTPEVVTSNMEMQAKAWKCKYPLPNKVREG
jgi:hypothetical protein